MITVERSSTPYANPDRGQTTERSATPCANPDRAWAFLLRFNVHAHNIVLSPRKNYFMEFLLPPEGAAKQEHRAITTRCHLKLPTIH